MGFPNFGSSFLRAFGQYGPQQPTSPANVAPRPDEIYNVPIGTGTVSTTPDETVNVGVAPRIPSVSQPIRYDESVNVGTSRDPRQYMPQANMIPPQINPNMDWARAMGQDPQPDETMYAETERQPSIMDMYRENLMNIPERQHMTYPKNINAGLQKGLELLAEDSPTKKNRVYMDGQAYQKSKVYTDKEGKQHFIEMARDPSFADQVLKTLPAAMSPAVDILNQRRADDVEDWKMKNTALREAATAENNAALANYRNVQAGAVGRNLDIKQMDANTRAYLASLKDLPESTKQQMLQDGKMTIEEYRAQQRYSLQELRGTQQQELEKTRQLGREKLEGIKQSGRISLQEAKSADDQELEELKQSGRLDLESEREVNREILNRQRGDEARRTKAVAPGGAGATSQLPTQQVKAFQLRANQAVQEHPEWRPYIHINPDTNMVDIDPNVKHWYGDSGPTEQMYNDMVKYMRGATTGPAPVAPAPSTGPAAPAPAPNAPAAPTPQPAPAPGGQLGPNPPGGKLEMVTPDGKGTRLVPYDQIQNAQAQGFQFKKAT